MRINEQDLRRIADAARLEFTEAELAEWAEELNRILQYWAKLEEVETTGVPPFVQAWPTSNRWREDTVKPSLPREDALQNASAVQDGHFKVVQSSE
ncbi:MAG: Asp-tRNA(Asn)/Glu-tRNA(Gln) amidotransferase subunit GatC [Firmicutes bacterium]|nr:Asp-tRNA(Asn)/Glu-tRNA(Gln) amidotransferase subunit GatC [Bacillota bacterium]